MVFHHQNSKISASDIGNDKELDHIASKVSGENHKEYPDDGLSHLTLSKGKDLLQSTITPFDYYNPIQVIKHPKNEGEFITVQYVVQYIRAIEKLFTDKELPLYVKDGEDELTFTQDKSSEIDTDENVTEINCGFCKKALNKKEGYWHSPKGTPGA